ncbi:hypothetical protein BDZ97DRAFT_1922920 [Flammula alnicola]|nr:hypothetical protein BDZ97DRAFT_1922920 [Flammula alnicola]
MFCFRQCYRRGSADGRWRRQHRFGHRLFVGAQALNERLKNYFNALDDSPGELSPRSVEIDTDGARYNEEVVAKLVTEIPKLRATLVELLPEETSERRTKLIWELNSFVAMVDTRLNKAKTKYEKKAQEKDDEEKTDTTGKADFCKTLSLVREAVENCSANRQVIHVADVQKSVAADLEYVNKRRDDHDDKGRNGLEDEKENKEEEELDNSMAASLSMSIRIGFKDRISKWAFFVVEARSRYMCPAL